MCIRKNHPRLSLRRQCRLLSLSRSVLYYTPVGESAENLALMKLIDRQFLETPWYGSRQMARWLRRQGHAVGRHRVRRLMRKMRLVPIYQPPRTSQPHPQHKVYPYLLKDLEITRPNHVWCTDITYIPMRRGFLYLVAIMDWATRKVLTWRLSNSEPCRAIGPRDNGERRRTSASRPCKRPWRDTASPRSSTPTRAASLPASSSPRS